MAHKSGVICSICSKESHKPLCVVLDPKCSKCLKDLIPKLKIFFCAESAFRWKRTLCVLPHACQFYKVIFDHKEKFKDHDVFLVDFL